MQISANFVPKAYKITDASAETNEKRISNQEQKKPRQNTNVAGRIIWPLNRNRLV